MRRPISTIIAGAAIVAMLTAPVMARAEPAGDHHRTTGQATLNLNEDPGEYARAAGVGYNILDTGPWEEFLDELPEGTRGLLWAGNTQCGDWDMPLDEFKERVDALADHPKVFGWFLSDEPYTRECPEIVEKIRERADYVRRKAPEQKTFVVAEQADYAGARPKNLHVDYVGIDPYPCLTDRPCDFGMIKREYGKALDAGIPRNAMVPKYQLFGQSCADGSENKWRLPSRRELIKMLLIWHTLLPHPAFEMSYSWANQEGTSCPTLADADGTGGRPNLQRIMKLHNTWHGAGNGRSLEEALSR